MQLLKRITTSATTAATAQSGRVSQIIISCDNAGTGWTIRIEDNGSPVMVLWPTTTLAVPTTGPLKIFFDVPVRVNGGIDIITVGTPGIVTVAIEFLQPT
jgi:hypothetical protein